MLHVVNLIKSVKFWRSNKATAVSVEGMGFDSHAGQIKRSVAKDSPPLRRFFGATLPRRFAVETWPIIRYG